MADAFNTALQWLRRAFNAHQDNLEELDARWVAVEEMFDSEVESGRQAGTFAQWVHTSHAISKQHVELVMRYYYNDGYEKLRPKVRAPLEAVAAHWKTSVWDIYFTFYQEVAQSRLALLAIRKLQRHKPDLKMLDLLVATQTARAQRKKDNTRGVRTDTNTFFNWDIQSAVQALYGEATPPASPQSSSSINHNLKRKQINTVESPSKRRRSSSVEVGRGVIHPDPEFDDSLLRGSPGPSSFWSGSVPAEFPSPTFLGSSYGDMELSDGEGIGSLNDESVEFNQEIYGGEDTSTFDETPKVDEEPATTNEGRNTIDIERPGNCSSQGYSNDAEEEEKRSRVKFVSDTGQDEVPKDIEQHDPEHEIHNQIVDVEASGKASEVEPEEHEHIIEDDNESYYDGDVDQEDDQQAIRDDEEQNIKHGSNEQEDVKLEYCEQLAGENRQDKLSNEEQEDDGLEIHKPQIKDDAQCDKLHISPENHSHTVQDIEEPDDQQNDKCGQAEATMICHDQKSIAPDMPMTPTISTSPISIENTPTTPFETTTRSMSTQENVFDRRPDEEAILLEQKHAWGSRCLTWMSTTIRENDIAKLAPGNMVNDEIVNFCLDRLRLLHKRRQPPAPTYQRVEIFNTFFYPKILSTLGNAVEEARMISRWGSWEETTDHLVIPINIQNYHWYFAVVSDIGQLRSPDGVQSTYITIIDSLGAGKERQEEHSGVIAAIQMFLSLKCKHWNLAIRPESIGIRTSYNVPLQRNGTDCGIFLIELVARFIVDPRTFLFNAQYLNWSLRIDATKTRRWIERQIWIVWLNLNITQASTRTTTTAVHAAPEMQTATKTMQPIPWRPSSESILEKMILEAEQQDVESDQLDQFSVEKCFAAFFLDTRENVTWYLDQPLCLVQSRRDARLVYKLPRENLLYTVYDILPMHQKLVNTDDESGFREESSPTSSQHVNRLTLISNQIISHREMFVSLSSLVDLLEVTWMTASQVENPFSGVADHCKRLISKYRNDLVRLKSLESAEMRKVFSMMMHNKIKEAEAEVAHISQMEAGFTERLTAGREKLDKRIEAAKREQVEVTKLLKLLEDNLWAESQEKAERIRLLRKELEMEEVGLAIMEKVLEDRVRTNT